MVETYRTARVEASSVCNSPWLTLMDRKDSCCMQCLCIRVVYWMQRYYSFSLSVAWRLILQWQVDQHKLVISVLLNSVCFLKVFWVFGSMITFTSAWASYEDSCHLVEVISIKYHSPYCVLRTILGTHVTRSYCPVRGWDKAEYWLLLLYQYWGESTEACTQAACECLYVSTQSMPACFWFVISLQQTVSMLLLSTVLSVYKS